MGKTMLAHAVASQMLACLSTLKDCIDRCPAKEWNEKHDDHPFSQVVFHALFDCDLSLCAKKEDIKEQGFHKKNRELFDDYEELEDGPRTHLYTKKFLEDYYSFCVKKVASAIESKEIEDFVIPNNDVYGNMTLVERYINAIRHLQHHTAQLGFRLQYLTGAEMNWISRGYEK